METDIRICFKGCLGYITKETAKLGLQDDKITCGYLMFIYLGKAAISYLKTSLNNI